MEIAYLIENEKGLWLCIDIAAIEICKGRYDKRCTCKECRYDMSPDYYFSNNVLEAMKFHSLEKAQDGFESMKSQTLKSQDGFYKNWRDFSGETDIKNLDDCKITEHHFEK